MSQNRSAEWLRGRIAGLAHVASWGWSDRWSWPAPIQGEYDLMERLLAEAEAREESVPTAADLAVADELDMLSAHIQECIEPDDARDDIRRICRNRAKDLRRGVKRGPSAAEVIAAAERALQDCRCVVNIVCNDHEYSAPGDAEAMAKANDTITLIEKWKEAQRG